MRASKDERVEINFLGMFIFIVLVIYIIFMFPTWISFYVKYSKGNLGDIHDWIGFTATLLSGMGGGLVGGMVAYFIAKMSIEKQKKYYRVQARNELKFKRLYDDRKQTQKLAYSCEINLSEFYSNFVKYAYRENTEIIDESILKERKKNYYEKYFKVKESFINFVVLIDSVENFFKEEGILKINEFERIKDDILKLLKVLYDNFNSFEENEENIKKIEKYKNKIDFFVKYNLELFKEIDDKLDTYLYEEELK